MHRVCAIEAYPIYLLYPLRRRQGQYAIYTSLWVPCCSEDGGDGGGASRARAGGCGQEQHSQADEVHAREARHCRHSEVPRSQGEGPVQAQSNGTEKEIPPVKLAAVAFGATMRGVSGEDTRRPPARLQQTVLQENYALKNESCGICGDMVIDRGVLDCCQHCRQTGVLPSFQHERPLRVIWRHDNSRPADWLMFRRSTTGMPTFSLSSWFGIPGNFKLFRNSVGYIWSMLLLFVDALHTVSELCVLKA